MRRKTIRIYIPQKDTEKIYIPVKSPKRTT